MVDSQEDEVMKLVEKFMKANAMRQLAAKPLSEVEIVFDSESEDNDAFNEEIDVLNCIIDELMCDNVGLSKEIQKLNRAEAGLKRKFKEKNQKLNRAEAGLKKKFKKKNREIDGLCKKIWKLRRDKAGLSDQIKQLNRNNAGLRKEIKKLKKQAVFDR